MSTDPELDRIFENVLDEIEVSSIDCRYRLDDQPSASLADCIVSNLIYVFDVTWRGSTP